MKRLASLFHNPLAWILAGFAVVIAFGLFYDYPLSTAGDELPLLTTTLKMIGNHTLRPAYPEFYHVPFATYVYLPFLLVWLTGLFVLHIVPTLTALKAFVIVDYFTLLPLARLVSLLSGLASLYFVYRIAEKLFKERAVALYATAFTATSLLFAYTSHFARVWPIQVTAILFVTYLVALLYERRENTYKDFALVGLAIGISFGVHFIGFLACIPFLAVLILKYGWRFVLLGRFWVANVIIAGIAAFTYYLNPYGFVNYVRSLDFLFNPATQIHTMVDYDTTVPAAVRFTYYLHVLVNYDPLLFIAALLGAYLLFRKNKKLLFVVGSFIAVYYPLISIIGLIPRYIAPIVPFLSLFAGYALYEGTKLMPRKRRRAACAALFILLSLPPLLLSVWMVKESTRSEAMAWIYAQVPAGKSVVLFDAFLPLNEDKETLSDVKTYTTDYTVKRQYLDTLSIALLPAPAYRVLTVPLYATIPAGSRYDYAVLSWRTEDERARELADLSRITASSTAQVAIKFGTSSHPLDIANDADSPLPYLFSFGQNGPTIEILTLRR